MKIKVTKEHIENGKLNDCNMCPIALVLNEILDDIVYVHRHSINIDYRSKDIEIPLPETAQAFISDFDNGHKVKPFTFELPLY